MKEVHVYPKDDIYIIVKNQKFKVFLDSQGYFNLNHNNFEICTESIRDLAAILKIRICQGLTAGT